MVKLIEDFQDQGRPCLVLELLHKDVYSAVKNNEWRMQLHKIRLIAKQVCVKRAARVCVCPRVSLFGWTRPQRCLSPFCPQLLTALHSLSEAGIVHCDLKPDNIMFVSREQRKIKLIDFGLALTSSALRPGVLVQATSYRAPEILLGLPFGHAIDTWGAGCTFAFLYLQNNLFRARCGYEKVRPWRPPPPSCDVVTGCFIACR